MDQPQTHKDIHICTQAQTIYNYLDQMNYHESIERTLCYDCQTSKQTIDLPIEQTRTNSDDISNVHENLNARNYSKYTYIEFEYGKRKVLL